MAFGQSVGPAASGRQVKELLELLSNAGHADFRDARGPMGFNQRQAGGRFTADEAAQFIDQLQTVEYEAEQAPTPVSKRVTATASPDVKPSLDVERALRTASTKSLVLEVRRRGWTVTRSK